MKEAFFCSLFHQGLLGGGLYVTEDAVIYRTGKLTVSARLRDLTLPLARIQEVRWKGLVATLHLADGETWRFLIFNRPRFARVLKQALEQR